MSKNLIVRLAVAAVGIPIVLWICYQGGYWLLGMVSVFALMAFGEFLYREKISTLFGNIIFMLIMVWFLFFNFNVRGDVIQGGFSLEPFMISASGIIIFLTISMIFSIGKKSPAELFSSYTRLWWGIVYVGCLYPFIYLLGNNPIMNISGGDWLLFLLSVLWVGDSAAMFVGMAMGKHKLAPAVSPNKTVEGFVGGIIGAVIIGLIMHFWKFQAIGLTHMLIMAVGASVCGQLGDLVESMWKRSINIKDSSHIIPGHGGVLDRFDSLLFAAPFIYGYTYLMSFKFISF